MTRGLLSGLVGFTLAGILLAAVLGRVLPDAWSPGAFAAVGIAAAVLAGGAGGSPASGKARAGRDPRSGARRAALIALQPQADLVTLFSLLAVLAGATRRARVQRRSPARRRLG